MSSEPKKIDIPTFESEIPAFLMDSASPVEKHLLHLTSRIEKNLVWQNSAIVEVDFKQQETNGKVKLMFVVYRVARSRPFLFVVLFLVLLGYPAYIAVGPLELKQIASKLFSFFL